jgi:molybdopterin-containing oxidoreductase family iron-sulfur binding subunit
MFLLLFNQVRRTLGLALGYGRKAALKEEMMVGLNAYLYKDFNNVQSVTLKSW